MLPNYSHIWIHSLFARTNQEKQNMIVSVYIDSAIEAIVHALHNTRLSRNETHNKS